MLKLTANLEDFYYKNKTKIHDFHLEFYFSETQNFKMTLKSY